MSGLDDWLPQYDYREYHERRVERPPAETLDSALEAPSEPDWIVRALFRLRGIDGRGRSLAEFFAPPFAERLERTPTTFVARVTGLGVRVCFDLRARPAGDGSILSTETRVVGGGARFRVYWLVVRPFSGLVRRRWLIAAAKRAAAPSPNDR